MVNIKGSYSIQSYTHISLQYYLAFQSQTEKSTIIVKVLKQI